MTDIDTPSATLSAEQRLAIESHCRSLVGAYGFLADHRRYDEQTALFAEDGRYENPFTSAEGRAAIRSYLDTRPAGVATRHVCGQTFFEKVTADEAASITYVIVFGAPGTDEGPNEMDVGGSAVEFHNTFRREHDGWKITYHASRGVLVLKS